MVDAGQLLVATPSMHESTFDRTVILLLEHSDESSMGLVLNRRSPLKVSEALPTVSAIAEPDQIFLGGPVEEGVALVLAQADDSSAELHLESGGIGLIDLASNDPTHSIKRARVYSGYAGWGPRQLESELRSGSWIVAAAESSDLWASEADCLWARVIARQGDLSDFLAEFPQQPWLN